MASRVALDVDLGELPGEPEELYALATLVNVACGGHAGDEASMKRAVELARASGASIAAHPSYPDRARFGRVSIAMPSEALRDAVAAQCRALRDAGARLVAAKPHGALYHDTRDPVVARAVVEGVVAALGEGLTIVGPPRGALRDEALARGFGYAREGFADRATRPDGSLVPRTEPGALVTDPARAAANAVRLARTGEIEALCVHGDTPGAVTIARAVRQALEAEDLLAREGLP
jgi:UPF0271 protein